MTGTRHTAVTSATPAGDVAKVEARRPRGTIRIPRFLSIVLLFALWEALPRSGIVSADTLPPFSVALATAAQLSLSGELLPNLLSSLYRWAIGFAISLSFSIPAGMAMARNVSVRNFLDPVLTATYPIPKAALILIVMMWLGAGDVSKILVIVLGTSIPVVISSFHGAQGVDRNLIWSALAMGTNPRLVLFKIILPAAMPQILSGIRMALSVSLIALLGSEMIARQSGLGYLLFSSLDVKNYSLSYSIMLVIAVVGFILDWSFVAFMNRSLSWMEREEGTNG